MNCNQVEISVIIPSYNRAHLLPSAIESLQRQTCEGWELIIIDDGSEDGTREMIKDYLRDSRIQYFFQPHQGVSVARNSGAGKAAGSHLIFLDSDDKFHPDLIQSLYDNKFRKFDLIFWEVFKIKDGKQKIWKPRKLGGMYNNIKGSFLAGSICYRKSVFEQAGGYDPKIGFGENYELGLRVCQLKNLDSTIIHKPFLVYEVSTENRSSNSIDNRLRSGLQQYRKHLKSYEKHPKEKAEITYILGYLLEKKGNKEEAFKYYKSSWKSNPYKFKALVKTVCLFIIQ